MTLRLRGLLGDGRRRAVRATGLLALASLCLAVGAANAATVRVAVGGAITLTENGTTNSASLSGVAGDLVYTGTGSVGTLTVTWHTGAVFENMTGPGAGLTEFHGDVSQGCVRVLGDRALVIGRLPASEQFDIPFGHMEWVGVHLEDNGVAAGSAVDRGRIVFMRTASGSTACNAATTDVWSTAVLTLDAGDGTLAYTDLLDAHPSLPDSSVSVVDRGGLAVSITDAADPDGFGVSVGAGTGHATLASCGTQVNVDAGSQVVLTCGSLIARVVTGSATVVLGGGLTEISIPQGGVVEVAEDGGGGFTVENLGSVAVTVVVDGVESTIAAGETSTVRTWDFVGFLSPVRTPPALNQAKAGGVVPLKWRVLDAAGLPVTSLTVVELSVGGLDCTTLARTGGGEQTAAVGSGLQSLGGGYYQLNWKTDKAWGSSCKVVQLDIGDGVTHDAYFSFTR